jgi:hypothetical protein
MEKTTKPQFVALMIADDNGNEQSRFDARVWE